MVASSRSAVPPPTAWTQELARLKVGALLALGGEIGVVDLGHLEVDVLGPGAIFMTQTMSKRSERFRSFRASKNNLLNDLMVKAPFNERLNIDITKSTPATRVNRIQ
ncbi:hypothetical protein HDU89_006299 [Geranomyces variabilis]|nr:hypothetical protein HDU89_006299 [Geranomyces variabilis]